MKGMTTHQRLEGLWERMLNEDRKSVQIHLDQLSLRILQGDERPHRDGSLMFGPGLGLLWRNIPIQIVAMLDTAPLASSGPLTSDIEMTPYGPQCVTIEVKNAAGRTLYLDDEDNGPEWMA